MCPVANFGASVWHAVTGLDRPDVSAVTCRRHIRMRDRPQEEELREASLWRALWTITTSAVNRAKCDCWASCR